MLDGPNGEVWRKGLAKAEISRATPLFWHRPYLFVRCRPNVTTSKCINMLGEIRLKEGYRKHDLPTAINSSFISHPLRRRKFLPYCSVNSRAAEIHARALDWRCDRATLAGTRLSHKSTEIANA